MNLLDSNLVWCHGPLPEYEKDTDWADRYYIPARVLPLLRPRRDLAVIPGGREEIEIFAAFCIEILGLDRNQIVLTSGASYLLDQDISKELLSDLRNRCVPSNRWRIVPYSVYPEFENWAGKLSLSVFGDSVSFVDRFNNKSILHPPPGKCECMGLITQEVPEIKIPKGYTCASQDELLQAWIFLECGEALVKPTRAATGEGIFSINSAKDLKGYSFPMGDVVLEERLLFDASVSVQFNGTSIFGSPTEQLLNGFEWAGNVGPAKLGTGLCETLRKTVSALLAFFGRQGLSGPGGFDFVISSGIPYLVDVNIGRFTGAHIPKMFRERYAPESFFQSWKVNPKSSLETFWKNLTRAGIAFQPDRDRVGVFPICYLPDMWGMLISFTKDRTELAELQKIANSCL